MLLISVPGISIFIVVLTMSELGLVQRTSAVCLQVLAALHQIPIAFVGAAVYGEELRVMSVLGFLFCIVAAFVYAKARQHDRLEAEQYTEAAEEVLPEAKETGSLEPLSLPGAAEVADARG